MANCGYLPAEHSRMIPQPFLSHKYEFFHININFEEIAFFNINMNFDMKGLHKKCIKYIGGLHKKEH